MKYRGWIAAIVVNVGIWTLLAATGATHADPPKTQEPFANAVEQRNEMIGQLKEINSQLKDQNAMLRAALGALLSAPPRK